MSKQADQPDGAPAQWRQATLMDAATLPLSRLCGLDEVGRGALAGPLVAAAVILPDDFLEKLGSLAPFLRDSKTTPRQRREEVAALTQTYALALAIAIAPVDAINQRGVGWANRDVFRALIAQIDADEYIVDGKLKPPAPPDRVGRVRCLVKADAQAASVSAASIVAKVYRDHVMATLTIGHPSYAAYGWERNAGYGTSEHLAALRAYGPTSHHRDLFVKTALSGGQRAQHNATRTPGQLVMSDEPALDLD
jgi:ribonuclease HII